VFFDEFGQQDLHGRDVTVEAPPVDHRTFGAGVAGTGGGRDLGSARVTGERSRGRDGDRCGGWDARGGRLEVGERGVPWRAARAVLLEELGQDDFGG
jgi:hypothetical protein